MKASLPAARPVAATVLGALALALFFSLAPSPAFANSPAITKGEWTTFLRDPALQAADAKLNATYKQALAGLDPAGKKAVIARQRAWIRERNEAAFAAHPKGSPGYIAMLAQATLAREAELRERRLAPAPVTPDPVKNTSPGQATPPPAAPETPARPAAKPAAPAPQAASPAAPRPEPREEPAPAAKPSRHRELNVTIARDKSAAASGVSPRVIDITPGEFGRAYTEMALSLKTAPFPLVPTSITSNGQSQTEQYLISDAISMQFKYANGNFEKPEIITFIARRFMNGNAREKDETAYALSSVLKVLSGGGRKTTAARDAEIAGFMRSVTNAFTSDASRVWKNAELVYVITYMQKTDLFAMVITRDNGKK